MQLLLPREPQACGVREAPPPCDLWELRFQNLCLFALPGQPLKDVSDSFASSRQKTAVRLMVCSENPSVCFRYT